MGALICANCDELYRTIALQKIGKTLASGHVMKLALTSMDGK